MIIQIMDYSMLKSLCNMCTISAKLLGEQLQSSTPDSWQNATSFISWKHQGILEIIAWKESPLQSCNQVTHLLAVENLPFVSYWKFISFNWTGIPHELDLI